MAFISIKFLSEVLGRQTNIDVIIPQKSTCGEIGIANAAKDEEYKTLVLLHGLSDDNTIWARRTSIERYATEHGIAVIMPSGERSFYTDMYYGDKFYTYISQEVLKIAREYLPLSHKREDTFIAGNSMGGYGAIKIALKNPNSFGAAAGLSSVADINRFMQDYAPHLKEWIFGTSTTISNEEDLFYLVQSCNDNPIKPKIYMATGKQDFMYDDNVRLKEAFEKSNYSFTYEESEGDHSWGFWDIYIQKVLKWMLSK